MSQPNQSQPQHFDLEHEISECQRRKPWANGFLLRPLYRTPELRVILLAFEAGGRMQEHHVDAPISVHVLKGRVRFGVNGISYEVAANHLLTLGASIPHDVEGLEESAVLLTISSTASRK